MTARGKDIDSAMRAFKEIASDSLYKTRDIPTDEMRQQYISAHLVRALQEEKADNCDLAMREADEVLAMDEKNVKATRIRERCTAPRRSEVAEPPKARRAKEPVAQATSTKARTTKSAAAPAETEVAPAPPDGLAADDLFRQALDAYNSNAFEKAVELCKKTLSIKPYPLAVNTWVLSECKLKRKGEAARAFKQAELRFRSLLKAECKLSDV